MQNENATFGDKERIADLLASEKFLSANYNTFLAECATPEMRAALSGILSDTHTIGQQLFNEMNSRGWYPVTKAEDAKVDSAKQKFGAMTTAR